jgi:hypothetical protein
MSYLMRMLLLSLMTCALLPSGNAQPADLSLEAFINEQTGSYPFTPDNRFKLAAYAELKGHYISETTGFILEFGRMGSLGFYEKHCLLRTGSRVYVVEKFCLDGIRAAIVNRALRDLFEQISLLGNHGATAAHVRFVNAGLARKNLDPFDKLYTRHILLKYGKFDDARQRVTFHTDWLSPAGSGKVENHAAAIVRRHANPLLMELDDQGLRGYYVKDKGEVYIRDVARSVAFATGERSQSNVGAFKLFIQKLFIQSVQYLSDPQNSPDARPGSPQDPPAGSPGSMYHNYSWIPMMLTILRNHKVNVGDADVICYFVDQPYYPRLYEQMTREERAAADRYRKIQTSRFPLPSTFQPLPLWILFFYSNSPSSPPSLPCRYW